MRPQSLGELLALTLAQQTPEHVLTTTPAGTQLEWHGEGMLEITPAQSAPDAMALVLSAGIHGNETAPMELLDRLIQAIAADTCLPQVRVLALLGNPAAIRAGTRYCERDINRLFNGRHHGVAGHEAARAAELEQQVAAFFNAGTPRERLHYDMHTAIRGSRIPQFALYPGMPEREHQPRELDRLHRAGMQAVLLQHEVGITFSNYTYATLGAESMTLELGKANPFGMNAQVDLQALETVLRALIEGTTLPNAPMSCMRAFNVRHEVIKRSERFVLHLDASAENFTPLPEGMLLAEDDDLRWVIDEPAARIIFPNPHVANGLRAGLVIVPA